MITISKKEYIELRMDSEKWNRLEQGASIIGNGTMEKQYFLIMIWTWMNIGRK
jgi:hypothetical protein